MKKAISLALLIICVFILYQFGVTFFKNSHEIDYTIKNESYSFDIHEHYKDKKYYFSIQSGNYHFYFEQKNEFNKMRKVIEEIDFREEIGRMCIYPNYKNDIRTSIICSDTSTMYSYESSKTTLAAETLMNDLKTKGKLPLSEDEYIETKSEHNGITYYPSAFDEVLTIWKYQGFSVIDKERTLYQEILGFDRYDNTISRMVGKYYVTPVYTENRLYEFSQVYVFDVTNNVDFTIDLGTTLSNYTYVCGIVDQKLYLFDKNTMKQIEINPKNKNARVVAKGNEDALYYNGEWITRNIYDFVGEKLEFSMFDDQKLREKYSYQKVYQTKDSYYFYDGTGFYQVYKEKLDEKILLFEQTGMNEIKVIDGYIYYLVGDTVYKYIPNVGRRRMMQYKELAFNPTNIYDVYRK